MAQNYQESIDIKFTYNSKAIQNLNAQIAEIQKKAGKSVQIGDIDKIQKVSRSMDAQGNVIKETIKLTDELGNRWSANMNKVEGKNQMAIRSMKLVSTSEKDHAIALEKTTRILEDAKRKSKEYMASIKEHSVSTKMEEGAKKLDASIQKMTASEKKSTAQLNELGNSAKKAKADLGSLAKQASISGKATLSLSHMIRTAVKAFTVWISVTAVFFKVVQEVKDGIAAITALDTAFVELRKVSNLAVDDFDSFIGKAQEVARTVARTSAEVTQATADFARMGYSVRESLKLAESALMLVNVGDGISNVETSTKSLIATLKGFDMQATESGHIIDALNEVSNNFAVNTSDLASGIQRAGGTLAQSGTTFEQSLALLTATNEVLQKMEKSSTGLITISQRIRGVSAAFEDDEAPVNFTAKLGQAYKQIAGVSIMVDGKLRSTYDILKDMSLVWDDLSNEQQQYLGELSAGFSYAPYVQKCA